MELNHKIGSHGFEAFPTGIIVLIEKMNISQVFLCIVFIATTQAFPSTDSLVPGDVVEGDLIVDDKLIHLMEGISEEKRELYKTNAKWSKIGDKVKIPYTINGLDSSKRSLLREAFAMYKAKTCVEFVERKGERDFIEFVGGSGCRSFLGKQGRKQTLTLGSGCGSIATVLHELMHAIGFLHEQSRPGRNYYVNVLYENIEPGKESQFKNYGSYFVDVAGQPYDFSSLMHYKNKEFSKNGLNTIEAKTNPRTILGNDKGFSKIDVLQINSVYNCPARFQTISDFTLDIYTSDEWWSGTDSTVYVEWTDSNNQNSGEFKHEGEFESESVDHFEKWIPKLSAIRTLSIRHDNTGSMAGWHLDKVVLKDKTMGKTYTFKCSCWLEGNSNTKILTV